MNNSLDRLLEGIATALRIDVIPRLNDEYATGQALAIIDLINNIKLRVDWAVPPLLTRATFQRALIDELESLLADCPERPKAGADFDTVPADGMACRNYANVWIASSGPRYAGSALAPLSMAMQPGPRRLRSAATCTPNYAVIWR